MHPVIDYHSEIILALHWISAYGKWIDMHMGDFGLHYI